MVLDYRYEFKDQLLAKLKELNQNLSEMDKPCVTDQERQVVFKESLTKFQVDLEKLSEGKYHHAGAEPEMRLRARFEELLKEHYKTCCKRFEYYRGQEFYERLETLIQPYMSVHLPNVIDFTIVYQLIELEWKWIHESVNELLQKVTVLCLNTSVNLLKKHFMRFSGLRDLVMDQANSQLVDVERITSIELQEMIETE